MTPWYTIPEVLDILAVLPRVEMRYRSERIYGELRQTFVDGFVDSLDAWRDHAYERGFDCRVRVEDLVAAVIGERLCGLHWLSDEERLLALAGEVAALLAARAEAERLAA